MKQSNLFTIGLVIVALAAFIYFQSRRSDHKKAQPRQEQNDNRRREPVPVSPSDNSNRAEGLNRRVARLVYSKHARCRMDCRQIDESEVKEILDKGEINHKKSEPAAARGAPRYAVEGITHDNQRVRIIFAQEENSTVVVTVIDLGNEWQCDCK